MQTEDKTKKRKRITLWRKIATGGALLFLALLYYFLAIGTCKVFVIKQSSMYPTLHEGDFVFGCALEDRNPERYDVVYLRHPINGQLIVKRVIGIPSDTIEVRNGILYINQKRVDLEYDEDERFKIRLLKDHALIAEEYIDREPVALGPDEYFVLGDNKNRSDDSLSFGAVNREAIIGRLRLVYWPPSRIKSL